MADAERVTRAAGANADAKAGRRKRMEVENFILSLEIMEIDFCGLW